MKVKKPKQASLQVRLRFELVSTARKLASQRKVRVRAIVTDALEMYFKKHVKSAV